MGVFFDCYGCCLILLVLLFGLGIDFLIVGFVLNVVWLFVGCFVVGIMGVSIMMVNVYIVDIFMLENCVWNYGFIGVMFGFGFICGLVFGGVFGGFNLWFLFFVVVGFVLVNWLYGFFILFELLFVDKWSDILLVKLNLFVMFK